MKINKMKYFIPAVGLLLGLSACNKEEEYFELETPADSMQISASKSEIVLDQFAPDDAAVTFKWGNPTERANGTITGFKFVLVDQSNEENRSQVLDLPLSTRSQSFSNRELNTLIKEWGYNSQTDVLILGKIIAPVESDKYMKPEVSSVTIQVSPYAGSMYLYHVSETGRANPISMTAGTDDDCFTWEGMLQPGKFWFSTTQNGVPALMKGDGNKVVPVYDNVESGSAYVVEQPSFCRVSLDARADRRVADVDIEVKYSCFMMLDGVASELEEAVAGSGCFVWTGNLAQGQKFAFAHDAAWDVSYNLDDKEGMMLARRDGNSFVVDKAANYVISVNGKTQTIIVLDICDMPGGWLSVAGDCFQGGQGIVAWSWENRKLVMSDPVNNPHILTYTATLKDSFPKGFKIMTQNRFAKEFVPATNGEDNFGTWCDMFTKGGDYKDAYWKPSGSGEVTIYVDTHNLKVKTDVPGKY